MRTIHPNPTPKLPLTHPKYKTHSLSLYISLPLTLFKPTITSGCGVTNFSHSSWKITQKSSSLSLSLYKTTPSKPLAKTTCQAKNSTLIENQPLTLYHLSRIPKKIPVVVHPQTHIQVQVFKQVKKVVKHVIHSLFWSFWGRPVSSVKFSILVLNSQRSKSLLKILQNL